MVDYVQLEDGKPPPPRELVLSWQLERFQALPDAGGYLDQDAGLMYRIIAVSNIYDVLCKYRNSQGAQIHALSDSDRSMLRFLKDQGLYFV